ncbi:hypothetical protein QT330_29330 (plasmid) [Escherichia coli]|nr:hypothetical protein [Escherichia coli]MDM4977375.1 hypothetical protein [Escherichia coli]
MMVLGYFQGYCGISNLIERSTRRIYNLSYARICTICVNLLAALNYLAVVGIHKHALPILAIGTRSRIAPDNLWWKAE